VSEEVEIQRAIVTALRASSSVTAIVGERVYDKVPLSAPRPYIHFRSVQVIPDTWECVNGSEVTAEIDLWTDNVGKVQAGSGAKAIRRALHEKDLAMPDPYVLDLLEVTDTTVAVDEANESLVRARITLRALIEDTTTP
jgi:hypothetical protein